MVANMPESDGWAVEFLVSSMPHDGILKATAVKILVGGSAFSYSLGYLREAGANAFGADLRGALEIERCWNESAASGACFSAPIIPALVGQPLLRII